jgi:hypothetical protein
VRALAGAGAALLVAGSLLLAGPAAAEGTPTSSTPTTTGAPPTTTTPTTAGPTTATPTTAEPTTATPTTATPTTATPTTGAPPSTSSAPTSSAPTSTAPTSAAPPDPTTGTAVTGAQFRWGLSQEAGNAAYAPGTVNLFSAGKLVDAGPGQQITAERWSATTGDVRIEKRQPDGSYALATFAGLGTSPAGVPLTTPAAGVFSDHQVVLDGGTGSVDVPTGTATIAWDGAFTVAFYSGLTYFTVSDPELTVVAGEGEVTATLGGFAADMADPTRWEPLPDTEVVLAELSAVQLTAQGFVATPDYLGVSYDPPAGSALAAQDRTGPDWGAFPASFLDFQVTVGQAPYWYSSGAPTDRFKAPLPITVSFDADDPVAVPPATPPSTPPTVSNPVVPPPSRSPAPTSAATPRSSARPTSARPATATPPPVVPEPTEPALLAGSTTVRVDGGTDLVGLLSPLAGPRDLGWWAGGAGLLLVSLVVWLRSSGRLVLGRPTGDHPR